MAPAAATAAGTTPPPAPPTRGVSAVVTAPVVVVGGGLAGLAAALAAAEAGAPRVLVVDKARGVGGNSAKASSGVSAVGGGKAAAAAADTAGDAGGRGGGGGGAGGDGEAAFRADLLRSGRGRSAVHLVDALAAQGGDALNWLEAQGVDLSDVRQLGGHSHARTHRPPQTGSKPAPVGWTIISALRARVDDNPAIEVIPHARVVALLSRAEAAAVVVTDGAEEAAAAAGAPDIDDAVLPTAAAGRAEAGGLVYVDTSDAAAGGGAGGGGGGGRRVAIVADAVVLTTGGYCAPGNPVLAAAAPAALAGLPSTNAPLASGDGVRLAARLGAGTVDMDALQVHPTGFVPLGDAPPAGEGAAAAPPPPPTVFLAPEALRGCGGVLVDAAGARFVNELDARDAVTAAMTAAAAGGGGGDGRRRVFLVLSAAAVGAFGEATAAFYAARGLMARMPPPSAAADGGGGGVLAALEARVGLPAAAVAPTLAAYARSVEGVADGTGKKVFPQAASYELERLEREGLWVAAVTPALHYSMGGLAFSASAEVLSAATAKPIRRLYAAGEVTGGLFGGNRLGGCSLLDCAVFGRIAGRRAAAAAAASTADAPASAPPALSPSSPVALRLSARHFLSASGESDASAAGASAMFVLRFDLPSPLATTGATVGQYVAAAVPLPDGTTTRRFYSPISRPDDAGCLELLIKSPPPALSPPLPGAAVPPHMGAATVALAALRPGDVVAFDGPYGGLPFRTDAPGHLAAIVGGTGVSVGVQLVRHVLHAAAVRADAAAAAARDGSPAAAAGAGVTPAVTLVWAVATPEQLVFRDRMETAAASAAGRAVPLRVVFVVEEGADGMVAPPSPAAGENEAAAAVARLAVTPSGAGGGGGGPDGRRGVTAGGATVYAGRVSPALLAAELPSVAPRPDGGGAHMVLCGPPPMCKGVRRVAEAMGYQPGDIFSWV